MLWFLGKKGLSADIFKWILATVAGAIIIVFFYRFAFLHMGISETITERETVERFIDELDAFGISSSSSKSIEIRTDKELFFQCGSVGVENYAKDTQRIIYAPSKINANKIDMWTETWKFPFPVTNFYYLTDDKTKTIIIYDDNSVDFTKDISFPKGFNVKMVHKKNLDLDQINKQAYLLDELHLVYLTAVKDVKNIVDKFSIITPDVIEVDLQKNRINYYNRHLDTYYLGDEMLYGAFIAPEQYECMQKKALERLWDLAAVLEERARLLRGKTDDTFCGDTLFQLSATLKEIIGVEDGDELYNIKDRIKEYDTLLRQNDCVSAY